MSNDLIVVGTANDDTTHAGCLLLSQKVDHTGHIRKFAAYAVAKSVSHTLDRHPKSPLFVTSHGRTSWLVDSDDGHMFEATTLNQTQFAERTVFALACWTGCRLAQVMSNAGATYIGFNKAVAAIPGNKQTASVIAFFLQSLLRLIKDLDADKDIAAFVNAIEVLRTKSLKRLFKFRKLSRAYGVAYNAIDEWSSDFMVFRRDLSYWAPAKRLDYLRNNGGCTTELMKDR
jgi:hypothetical protein